MSLNRSRQKKTQIYWSYLRDIPLKDVCDLLGIEVNSKGFFLCPAHDDKKPSAQIRPNNRWKCFSCGEGGSTLDLVMYALGTKDIMEAVRFLVQYYPEGMQTLEETKEEEELPYISPKLIKEIGLSSNPLNPVFWKGQTGTNEKGEAVFEQKTQQIADKAEALDLILEKIVEKQISLTDYANRIFDSFPGLNQEAIAYIKEQTKAKIKELDAAKAPIIAYQNRLTERGSFTEEIDDEARAEFDAFMER